jgi:hypothetical protein
LEADFEGFSVVGARCALRITGAHQTGVRWWLGMGLGAFQSTAGRDIGGREGFLILSRTCRARGRREQARSRVGSSDALSTGVAEKRRSRGRRGVDRIGRRDAPGVIFTAYRLLPTAYCEGGWTAAALPGRCSGVRGRAPMGRNSFFAQPNGGPGERRGARPGASGKTRSDLLSRS